MDLRQRFESLAKLLFRDGEKIMLAVSGGIDSMCMAELFRSCGLPFSVAHCNFRLRGKESDGDSALVEKWCTDRNVAFHRKDFDTSAYAAEKRISVEMAARELRYAWFDKLCTDCGTGCIAVAHNANDNAETLILNMLRGTGTKGMCGMHVESALPVPGSGIRLVRPLLGFSRKDIEDFVKEKGVPYRNDSTNALTEYKRNKIRHLAFPVFEAVNPSFLDAFARDMANVRQVERIADSYFLSLRPRLLLEESPERLRVDVKALKKVAHPEYVVYRLLEPFGFSSSEVSSLLSMMEPGGTFSGKVLHAEEWTLMTSSSEIVIEKKGGRLSCPADFSEIREGEDSVVIEGEGEYEFGGKKLSVSVVDRDEILSLRQPSGVSIADAEVLTFPFLVRKWKSGDWMVPLGMRGRKKLSDMFTDLKFSVADKAGALVAVSPGMNVPDEDRRVHVAALVGYRVDDKIKVGGKSRKILVIRIGIDRRTL